MAASVFSFYNTAETIKSTQEFVSVSVLDTEPLTNAQAPKSLKTIDELYNILSQ